MSKSESEKNSQQWSSYNKQYQQIMALIPSVFSKVAISLLLPSLDTSTDAIRLVDIAAGPGVFNKVLFQHMVESNKQFPAGSRFLVTDFASGMVETAKNSLLELDLASIGAPALDFRVVDACDPHDIEDGTYTHMVCMFGIMFFPHRAQALRRLLGKLETGKGRVVFGSWCTTATVQLCNEFGLHVDPTAQSKRPPLETSPLSVCADPSVFKQELLEAGFTHVEVVQRDQEFEIPNDDSLFAVLFTNPAILGMYPEFSSQVIPTDVLWQKWQEFLHGDAGHKWLRVDAGHQEVVVLYYQANLAFGLA
ncbi:class I SAM-dependent methyltransferase [archaeon]|nr:MAG: class I SAM-dependent methyltransferase [archaeon]